jgi:hypothetical protein
MTAQELFFLSKLDDSAFKNLHEIVKNSKKKRVVFAEGPLLLSRGPPVKIKKNILKKQ